MSNKPFMADSWFNFQGTVSSPKADEQVVSTPQHNNNNLAIDNKINSHPGNSFSPYTFFVPDWKGEGLISKAAVSIKNLRNKLYEDAVDQFKKFQIPNSSLRISIYNEFLVFADSKGVVCDELDSHMEFWKHLKNNQTEFKNIIDEFIQIYCFKVVALYLCKIHFIVQLSKESSITLSENNLLNPSFFLTKIFKTNSSSELNCESLQTNQYSWYRPSIYFKNKIFKLIPNFNVISISEMTKICSYNLENLDSTQTFANKFFGKFLNHLLIRLPEWLETNKRHDAASNIPLAINSKFAGNDLSSLALSHWSSQDEQLEITNNQIVCPNFIEGQLKSGCFLKLSHELKFLTYLVRIAAAKRVNPVELICQTIRKKYSLSSIKQGSLFAQHEIYSEQLYKRVVLNLTTLPKTNSHHYLLTQIYEQTDSLAEDGYLYVLTSQNLFVPSHSKKVEQLLTSFKLESFFNFGSLSGKGELPDYIYVFSKNVSKTKNQFSNYINSQKHLQLKVQKKSCLTFRCSGELSIFSKFGDLVEEFSSFLNNRYKSTPIYQKELKANLSFEFHQNAIVEGKLLHSTSNDPSKITHPNFFKNLTKSCIPLEHCFKIESLNNITKQSRPKDIFTSALLGITIETEDNHPLVLIVNQTNPNNVKIELINNDIYKAKMEKYGLAYYHYYGLTPKIPDINIDLFRDFFNTDIGVQILQLSLCDGATKLKSKLKALLIPKFFLMSLPLPYDLAKKFQLLSNPQTTLLETHPNKLNTEFSNLKQSLSLASKQYPFQTMSLLSYFKLNLENSLKEFPSNPSGQNSDFINYNNPIIIEPLVNLKTCNIFPNNNEIYIEFLNSSSNELHLPLTETFIRSNEDNCCLELISGEMTVVRLYTEKQMLRFIDFIISSAINSTIGEILQNLQVPKINDFNLVINSFQQMEQCFKSLHFETLNLINQLINHQISTPPALLGENCNL